MPPKTKSAKAVQAELKKKNTAQAEEIVAMLRRDMGNSDGDSSDDATEIVKKPPNKKNEKAVVSELKRKSTVQAKETVAKRTTKRNVKDMVSKANTTKGAMKETSSSSENGGSIIDLSETENVAEKPQKRSTSKAAKSDEVASSSMISKAQVSSAKVANKKSTVPSKTSKSGTSKSAAYQYEIDCQKVADSIDVTDLQRHLEKHLKVNGQKGKLGDTVSICCQGHKVIIKSKTFMPKKSLRFLSKKFLKRNWNIQVLSKNPHAYEYKYVGTQ